MTKDTTNLDTERLKEELNKASQLIKADDKALQQNRVLEEQEAVMGEWKSRPALKIEFDEFKTAEDLIKVSAEGYATATILYGDGGTGKSYLAVETVKQIFKPHEWDYKGGYVTPLALYKWLYHHRDKKYLVGDDLEGIWDSPKAVNMLKGALWQVGGKRLVFYDSTSEKLDVPKYFELKANLLLICNKIPRPNDRNVSALLDRAITFNLNFSFKQRTEIILKILEARADLTAEQKESIKGIIGKCITPFTKKFSIRTMELLTSYYKYDSKKAETLLLETLEVDEVKELVAKLMQSGLAVNDQAREFYEKTGKSRATYFRIKKQVVGYLEVSKSQPKPV